MRAVLSELLAAGRPILADGATGTNFFQMGLEAGAAPEFWCVDHPDRVRALHQQFVDAGAQIILTNSFGGTRNRLALHHAQDRVHELAAAAARIAREVADAAPHPVVVAGSVGPTGDLLEPLGSLTETAAIAAFREQIDGLVDGGVDVIWIETMSAVEEFRCAAQAAIDAGMPYTVTCSFDTAGRTMMGLAPAVLAEQFAGLERPPLAIGANCGVGASDLLATVLAMTERDPNMRVIAKANCGVPHFVGTEVVYSGSPELMGEYAGLAIDAGAAIVGGCCGTSPEHLAAMRVALDAHEPGARPDLDAIVARTGPCTNQVAASWKELHDAEYAPGRERGRRRGRGDRSPDA